MLKVDVNTKDFDHFVSTFPRRISPSMLEEEVFELARQAGVVLHAAAVKACIEAIYDHPNYPSLADLTPSSAFNPSEFGGNLEERTGDLLHAHRLLVEGLDIIVDIDPDYPVTNPHEGRELVIDYAADVHDGYTQWVFGRNTGVFHPGRFWMEVALIEATPVIVAFVEVAFIQLIEKATAA